jgi:succinyl-diaminopimelate desuccinylase
MTDVDRDLVIELTRQMIRMRSVNPPGDERQVAEYLAGIATENGLEAEIQPLDEGRANCLIRLPGGDAPDLVFTGHLDVVPPGEQAWDHDPFGADLTDGRIYGRGSADMKGGVAAILAAMIGLQRAAFRPAGDVVLAATAGEEAGLYGARAMVEQHSLDGAGYLVVAEPSDLDVFVAEKGVLWMQVHYYGRTAHGSMPWLGVNAVSAMARLIPVLESYPFSFEESPSLGEPTLSVNIIDGGNKTNVVPDHCRIVLDMRTVPSQDHALLIEAVRRRAEEVAATSSGEIRVDITVDQDDGSVETDPEEPLVEALAASVAAVTGRQPRIGGVTYATDAAVLVPGFEIPMVICGPGAPGMAHQPDEYVEVEQLVEATAVYADLARRLLNDSETLRQ